MNLTQKDGTGNTRLIPHQEFSLFSHLDYLTVRVNLCEDKFHQFLDFIDSKYLSIIPEARWSPGGGRVYFDNRLKSPLGINGGYSVNLETSLYDCMVQLSGQYFSAITVENQWRLLRGLKYAFAAKCTRIDLAVDDPSFSVIPLSQMEEAYLGGYNFNFKNSHQYIENTWENGNLINNKTVYFGSRNSGKMVRIYDHDSECLRFEVEYKRKYASVVFDLISSIDRCWFYDDVLDSYDCMDAINEWNDKVKKCNFENLFLHGCKYNKDEFCFDVMLQKVIGGIAVTSIDFRDRSSRKDRSKASYKDTKRCNFYQEFIDKIGTEIRIHLPTTVKTIEKTIAWMQRQVAKTISIIYEGLGYEKFSVYMRSLVNNGKERQGIQDYKLIQLVKDNPRICVTT